MMRPILTLGKQMQQRIQTVRQDINSNSNYSGGIIVAFVSLPILFIVLLLLLLLLLFLFITGFQRFKGQRPSNININNKRRRTVNFVRTRSRTDSWNASLSRSSSFFAAKSRSRNSISLWNRKTTATTTTTRSYSDSEMIVDKLADEYALTLIQQQQDDRQAFIRSPRRTPTATATTTTTSTKPHSIQTTMYWRGPGHDNIVYHTWTPPPTWNVASRNLLANSKSWKTLQRTVSLVITTPNVIRITQGDQQQQHITEQPLSECSFHVHRPLEGGVLELYNIGNTTERFEHTFASAQCAAQFQLDFLALSLFGSQIYHLYTTFEMMHKGSAAFRGCEPVLQYRLRNDNNDDNSNNLIVIDDCGIAWDDVMRCLGVHFKWIRLRLEAMRWLAINARGVTKQVTARGEKATDTTTPSRSFNYLTPEYADPNKRLLLGAVDFFRLFIPLLPNTAVPEGDSSRLRTEQLLRWRKRVARAAVLAHQFVQAKVVLSRGWDRPVVSMEGYWTRRLAFDENGENARHDATTRHEYYEGSVSRDVTCQVRSAAFLKRKRCWWKCGLEDAPQSMSCYQGYMLVGMHTFRWLDDESLPLHYTKDPVQNLPDLRALIQSYPDLHFFVHSFFFEPRKTAAVHVYVRSLPTGVDQTFDTVVDRFVNGDAELRRRKLEVILQLGVGKEGLNLFAQCLLWMLSFLLRISLRGQKQVPQSVSFGGRTTIPALNLAQCGDTFHFGGALHTDSRLPTNYVSCTCHMGSRRNNNFVSRVLLSYLEFGIFEEIVSDMTVVFAGETEDELPERAVCSIRTVREPSKALPLAIPETNGSGATTGSAIREYSNGMKSSGVVGLCLRVFVADPLIASSWSIVRLVRGLLPAPPATPPTRPPLVQRVTRVVDTDEEHLTDIDAYATDPLEKAVNEIVRALRDIELPMRTGSHWRDNGITDNDIGREASPSLRATNVSILRTISRSDIKRFLVASHCSLRLASERLIATVLWRHRTFPIDTRTCRIELQSGQFFHQGIDLDGHPIFYFRNLCLGPWRKDEDAVIAAVLHRFESHLNEWCKTEPEIKCTLIILQGFPYTRKALPHSRIGKGKKDAAIIEQATTASTATTTLEDKRTDDDDESKVGDDETALNASDGWEEAAAHAQNNNPRIHQDELWYTHTSRNLITRLTEIALEHYPERLHRAIVVLGHGSKNYFRSRAGAALALSTLVGSARTRDRVRFLSRYSSLQAYVDPSQLITTVGGTNIEDPDIFECKCE